MPSLTESIFGPSITSSINDDDDDVSGGAGGGLFAKRPRMPAAAMADFHFSPPRENKRKRTNVFDVGNGIPPSSSTIIDGGGGGSSSASSHGMTRGGTKIADTGAAAGGVGGGDVVESHKETLRRRRMRSRNDILEQFTIHVEDYRRNDGRGDEDGDFGSRGYDISILDELSDDVRGLLRQHGLVVIRDALSEEQVSIISHLADATLLRICDALDHGSVPYDKEINDEETHCYREVAVRCRGRMDVRHGDDDCDDDDGNHDAAHVIDGDDKNDRGRRRHRKLPSLPLIDGLVNSVLHGPEIPNLVYAGWIYSFPNSSDQPWHTDGCPLFDEGSGISSSLPCYAVNVFCGIQHHRHHDDDNDGREKGEAKLLELGPTEFVVGSHRMDPNDAMNGIDDAVSVVLGRGDILLYDYRICHRVSPRAGVVWGAGLPTCAMRGKGGGGPGSHIEEGRPDE
jgi:hypothetical protein